MYGAGKSQRKRNFDPLYKHVRESDGASGFHAKKRKGGFAKTPAGRVLQSMSTSDLQKLFQSQQKLQLNIPQAESKPIGGYDVDKMDTGRTTRDEQLGKVFSELEELSREGNSKGFFELILKSVSDIGFISGDEYYQNHSRKLQFSPDCLLPYMIFTGLKPLTAQVYNVEQYIKEPGWHLSDYCIDSEDGEWIGNPEDNFTYADIVSLACFFDLMRGHLICKQQSGESASLYIPSGGNQFTAYLVPLESLPEHIENLRVLSAPLSSAMVNDLMLTRQNIGGLSKLHYHRVLEELPTQECSSKQVYDDISRSFLAKPGVFSMGSLINVLEAETKDIPIVSKDSAS